MYKNTLRERLYLIATTILLLLPLLSFAQPLDTRHKVDTLSLAERFSVRTNGTDWVLMIPNVGVEFDIRNTNWNRWAVNLNLRHRPTSNTNTVSPIVYEGTEIKVEGRMYWRERQAQANGVLAYHLMPWDKLMSCRRMIPKHPNTVFYRGIYASYGNYAVRAKGYGHRGNAFQAGITWGFVRPVYAFGNGNSIDMEIGVSGGVAVVKNRRFIPDYKNNDYRDLSRKNTYVVPMLNDVHAALVYRLGKYPIQKKYRWRYDVDMDYRARMDSLYQQREAAAELKHFRDSVYKVVAADFRLTYDSVIAVRHQEKQERINMSAPARKKYIKVKREIMDPRQRYIEESQKRALLKKEEE